MVTASATLARDRDTERVQTALSATASVRAEPVKTIPLSERAANPEPTIERPRPIAADKSMAATIVAIALRRSI